jgi:hypothetical protein
MQTAYMKTWTLGKYQIDLGISMVCFGLCVLVHCWGDFGGHIVIGPIALQINRQESMVLEDRD